MLGVPLVAALALLGIVAGTLGALLGIGGGVLLVPALVLLFGVAPHAAVAASLVGVVATSTATGTVHVGSGVANMRLGMALEIATTIGGMTGAFLASHFSPAVLAGAFGGLLAVVAFLLGRGRDPEHDGRPKGGASERPSVSGWEAHGALAGAYYDARSQRLVHYRARRVPLGALVSLLAGIVSGLLGVGGGFLKVPAMSLAMGIPIRVAAATSNFMIGVTALASLVIYLQRGFVDPPLVGPLVLGITVGSFAGVRIGARVAPRALRLVMAAVLALVAVEMIVKAAHGHFA